MTVARFDAFSARHPAVQNTSLPGERDLRLWLHRAPGEPHPLETYRWRSARPIALGKNIVDPERMASYEVRCLKSRSTAAQGIRTALTPLAQG